MIKTCAMCGKAFEGHGNAKYCLKCRKAADRVSSRRYYRQHRETISIQRKAQRWAAKVSKPCERCGTPFKGHGKAKYCIKCREEKRKERALKFFREQPPVRHSHVQECEICGKVFEVKRRAKYCTDCRADAYKAKAKEYKRRYDEARRKGQTIVKPKVAKPKAVAKPKYDSKKARLAYLRKCLEQAQTPEVRKRYFRQYVLLKQELLRGAMS